MPDRASPDGCRPIASVVVPAHDEQGRIGATLRTLTADAGVDEFEIVVVCNGSADATADEARQVAGVQVVEIAPASKIEALREGDRRTDVFPRIYLDGDVRLSTAAARAMTDVLSTGNRLVAGVPGRYRLDEASPLVRLFYEFRQRLPVFADGIIGAGVYAMSADGRRRFGEWPDVLGDDQFVYRLFDPRERAVLRDHHTVVEPATDLRTVVRRGVRVRNGNDQLGNQELLAMPLRAPSAGLWSALRASLGSLRGIASAGVFVAVMITIRLRTRFGRGGDWSSTPASAP